MTLNNAQRRAVCWSRPGPLLIVAGAGTGKTRVLTERFLWLVDNNKAKPAEILALTFTDKAAAEMEGRIEEGLPLGHEELHVETFHAFGKELLCEYGLDGGIDPGFKILTEADQYLLVRKNFDKFKLDYYRPQGNPVRFIDAILKVISRAKDEEVDHQEFARFVSRRTLSPAIRRGISLIREKTQRSPPVKGESREAGGGLKEIANFYLVYERLCREQNYLDYGDLIMKSLWLLKKRAAVLKAVRAKFKYILVDEFQDTNTAQYKLTELIAKPKNNLMVVGDDDQSLYRWRGAAISNILNFKKDYPRAQEIVLKNNYRSTREILDCAYATIQNNNPNRLEARLNISKKLSARFTGSKPEFYEFASGEMEIRFVIDKVKELVGSFCEAREIAILARNNSLLRDLADNLAAAGIDYDSTLRSGLFQESTVQDALSYLRVLVDPADNVAMFATLNIPSFGLTPDSVYKITREAKKKAESIFETLEKIQLVAGLTKAQRQRAQTLLKLIENHTRLAAHAAVSDVFVAYFDESGLRARLRRLDEPEREVRLNNLNLFYKIIRDFEGSDRRGRSLSDFMQEMDFAVEAGVDPVPVQLPEDHDSVKLLTVHRAKGLEFKAVFVVGLAEGIFPSREKKDPIELPAELAEHALVESSHMEEERRLFYVACTRAKEKLFLSFAHAYGDDTKREKKISRFVGEAGDGIVRGVARIASTGEESIRRLFPTNKRAWAHPVRFDLPSKLSFTQLTAFEHCPLQYKHAHLWRIKAPETAVRSYGQSVHTVLQRFFDLYRTDGRGGRDKAMPCLYEIIRASWIPDWYPSKLERERRYRRYQKDIRAYLRAELKRMKGVKIVGLEQEIAFKLGDKKFTGKIDRLQQEQGGTYTIIDYKTGTSKQSESPGNRFAQLLLYAYGLRLMADFSVGALELHYIGEKGEAMIDRMDNPEKFMERVVKKYTAFSEALQKSDFKATPSSYTCSHCDYYRICPERI